MFILSNAGSFSLMVIPNLITKYTQQIQQYDMQIYPSLSLDSLATNSYVFATLGTNGLQNNPYRGSAISVFDLDSNDYPDIMITTNQSNKLSTNIYFNEKGNLQHILSLNDSSVVYAFPFDLYEDG